MYKGVNMKGNYLVIQMLSYL